MGWYIAGGFGSFGKHPKSDDNDPFVKACLILALIILIVGILILMFMG